MTTPRRAITNPTGAPPVGAQPRVIVSHNASSAINSDAHAMLERNGDLYLFQVGDNITPSSYGDPEVMCMGSDYVQKHTPLRAGEGNVWYRTQGITQTPTHILFGGGASTSLQLYKMNDDLTIAASTAAFSTEFRDLAYDPINDRVMAVAQGANLVLFEVATLSIALEKLITGTVDGFTLSGVRAETVATDGAGNWFVGWYGVADGKGVYGVMRLDSAMNVTHTYCYTDSQQGLHPICVSYDAASSRVMMRCRGRYSIYGSHLILLNAADLTYINGVKLRDSYNHQICKSVRIANEYFTLLQDGNNSWLSKFDLSLVKQQEIYASLSSVTMSRYALSQYQGLVAFCVRANGGLGTNNDGIYILLDTDLHQYNGQGALCAPNLSFTQASNANPATNFVTSVAAIVLTNTTLSTSAASGTSNGPLSTNTCAIS